MPATAWRLLLTWGIQALFVLVALWSGPAIARQLHVRESQPGAEAIVRGRHVEYVIYFDGPVDHAASRLRITQADRLVQVLNPLLDSATDVLFASGEAPPAGRYFLHWEARSMDGDASAGDIPFSVAQ